MISPGSCCYLLGLADLRTGGGLCGDWATPPRDLRLPPPRPETPNFPTQVCLSNPSFSGPCAPPPLNNFPILHGVFLPLFHFPPLYPGKFSDNSTALGPGGSLSPLTKVEPASPSGPSRRIVASPHVHLPIAHRDGTRLCRGPFLHTPPEPSDGRVTTQ